MPDQNQPQPPTALRRARITEYVNAPRVLDRCVLAEYPPGLIDWKPPVEGAWTVREHLVHCADADLHSFVRFGKAIAESGSEITDWDQEAWRSALSYATQSATVSLQIIRLVRSVLAGRLSAVSPALWESATCLHPQRGIMTLDGLLAIYTAHVGMHHEFIARNEKLWESASAAERAKAKPCN